MIFESAKANAKNNDQLAIIGQIIDRCATTDEVNKVCALLASRTKLGLVFDEAPIVRSKDTISVLKKDNELSFKGTDPKSPHHKLILGDNYDALNNLLITHRNCIDVIYIDPPYNTGGSNLGYHDKFSKDAWLNFMKERMILARELLANDGVIFVSLDDNMQAYFKVLMDEIFGEENFICNFIWDKRNAQNDAEFVQTNHEFILMYSKNKNSFHINKKSIINDQADKKCFSLLLGNTSGGLLNNRFKMGQTLYWNPNNDDKIVKIDYDLERAKTENSPDIYKDCQDLIDAGYIPIRPKIYNGKLGRWKWSPEKMDQEKERLVVQRTKSGEYTLSYKDNREYIQQQIKSIISDCSSNSGSLLIHKLGLHFSNPKPSDLLGYLISLHEKKNAIVLDFFSGSGTTGEAVLELNREDGGTREFILCTLEVDSGNYIGKDVCYERLYRINNGITTNGASDFEWLKNHEPYHNSLDVYRVVEQKIDLDHDLSQIDLQVYNDLNQYKNFKEEDIPFIMNKLLDHLWGKK